MTYSPEQLPGLLPRIDAALRSRRLDDWQTKFITDVRHRIERYGTKTRLSGRQLAKLQEVIERGAPSNERQPQPPTTSPGAPRTPQRRTPRRPPPRRPSPNMVRIVGKTLGVPGAGFLPRYRHKRTSTSGAAAIAVLAVLGLFIVFAGGQSDPAPYRGGAPQLLTTAPASGSPPRPSPTARPAAEPPRAASPAPVRRPPGFTVTDGDTVQVSGDQEGTRLVGFNAPETYRARCEAERALGDQATRRLKQLVSSGDINLTKVACACAPGTEGTRRCNYGRSCGVLMVNGRDVGDILIAEGLAVPFHCGETRCPSTPRPWCG